MRRVLFAICCVGLLWTGCKEHDPPLSVGVAFSDTSYITSNIPTADAHQVLVEEFTGQSCPACPSGHNLLKSVSSLHPGLVNVIGLYVTDFSQTRPPTGSIHDFRDSLAKLIGYNLYPGINQLPTAGVDRKFVSGSLLLDQPDWSPTITSQLQIQDSLNLSDSSSFDSASNTATIYIKVTYLNQLSTDPNLSIAIVEDSMTDIQEDNSAPTGFDNTYLFTNVFRDMVTSVPQGDILIGKSRGAGCVIQKVYKYKLRSLPAPNPPINPAHCRVIAFVTSGVTGDYHVLQSVQCRLK